MGLLCRVDDFMLSDDQLRVSEGAVVLILTETETATSAHPVSSLLF